MNRIVLGAIAGFAATMPMTVAMRRLHGLLPAGEGYPLPPGEIVGRLVPNYRGTADRPLGTLTLLAHFGYGALTGAILPALTGHRSLAAGASYGIAVWAASYLGWVPASRVLLPASRHPARRNMLMLAVHALWGAALVHGIEELERSAAAFEGDRAPDTPARTANANTGRQAR